MFIKFILICNSSHNCLYPHVLVEDSSFVLFHHLVLADSTLVVFFFVFVFSMFFYSLYSCELAVHLEA